MGQNILPYIMYNTTPIINKMDIPQYNQKYIHIRLSILSKMSFIVIKRNRPLSAYLYILRMILNSYL